jgi:hypothetical protein
MRFKDILLRIRGISTPIFGISWNPPESEREIVRRLITYLEDRRSLIYPLSRLHSHSPLRICDSILEIRRELTKTMQQLSEDSKAVPHIRAMRAACLQFLDKTEELAFTDALWGGREHDPRER